MPVNTAFRVIFDRSAFHGDRFEAIRSSGLLDLYSRGVIKVYHAPVFLEETLLSYGAGEKAKGWRDHLSYCLDICTGIFLDRDDIWRNELVLGCGSEARYLLPERPNKRYDSRLRLIETLREKAASGDVSKEWAESAAMRKQSQINRDKQREHSASVRQKVATAIRERRVSGSARDYTFDKFRDAQLVWTGRQLMDLVDKKRSGALADQWTQDPERYPFYTGFVEGFLYAYYYAAAEHGRLDRNAQADYELMAHLVWADLVVSDDKRFFRRAFETIWKPRGKGLLGAEEFADLINRLL